MNDNNSNKRFISYEFKCQREQIFMIVHFQQLKLICAMEMQNENVNEIIMKSKKEKRVKIESIFK